MTLGFSREVIRLLPPPYETQCHDYRQDGYQCRSHCMAACKVQRYAQLDNGWPGDVPAGPQVTRHISEIWINAQSQTGHLEEGVTADSLTNCTIHCGSDGNGEIIYGDDCERIQYDVRTVQMEQRDSDDLEQLGTFTIGILPPQEVQLVIKHEPKYVIIEFLVSVA